MNLVFNPILGRELRSRWRDNRAFLLIFAVSFLLAAAAVWTYRDRVQLQEEVLHTGVGQNGMIYWRGQWLPHSAVPDLNHSMADVGRAVFRALTLFQIVAWLLIAPVIAAPVIAGEREKGLLEGLWLTRLKPISLLTGRLFSCLGFVVILQASAMPIAAMCLLFGGVSPTEVGAALGLQMMAALIGVSLGLCISARHPRPQGALITVLVTITLWSFVVFQVRSSMDPHHIWGGNYLEDIYQLCYWLVGVSHPVGAADAWLNHWFMNYTVVPDEYVLRTGLPLQGLICLVTLTLAWRAISRPLPEQTWLGKNPIIERYRRQFHEMAAARVARQEARASLSERTGQALLMELPVHLFVRFRNPLLQREVAARFRFRRLPLMLSLVRTGLVLFIAVAWIFMLVMATDLKSRPGAGSCIMYWLYIAGVIGIALFGATSFSREREGGTWEGLRLALLTPWEIVFAKWRAPLITLAYYAAPFWLLLLLTGPWLPNGLDTLRLTLTSLVVVSTLMATSAIVLWSSWRSRNSTTAAAWVLITLLLLHVAAPTVNGALGISERVAYHLVPNPQHLPLNADELGDYAPGDSLDNTWSSFKTSIEAVKGVVEAPLVFNALSAWDPSWRLRSLPAGVIVLRNIATIVFNLLLTIGFCWHLRLLVEREAGEGRPLRGLPLRRRLVTNASPS